MNEEKNSMDMSNQEQAVPPPQASLPIELHKADPVKRIIAFVIDSVITMIVGLIPIIGAIIGGLYMLLRDALPVEALEFKSVGKKLMKLNVVYPANPKTKIDYAASAKRNWMFALGPVMMLLAFIPIIGWIADIFILIALIILIILEIVKIFSDPKGIRLGDKMAGTMVIEE